jgi:hypothetical protein
MRSHPLPVVSLSSIRPTQAQTREADERAQFSQLTERLSPDARNLATLERLGVRGLNIHDVEGAAAHQAHVTAEGREAEGRANRIADYQHGLAVNRDERNERRTIERENRFSQQDLLSLFRDAHTRAAADYRARAAQTLDGTVTDELGNPITPEQLAEQYIQSTLTALEALEATSSTHSKGPKVIEGLRLRLPPGTRLDLNALNPRPGQPLLAAPPPQAPAGPRQTITRAELEATAQRLGLSVPQAEAEARKRGLIVR